MTPAQVWQDFNTEEKLDIVKNDETTENHCAYLVVTVTALKTEQGLLRAVLEIYKPLDKPSDKAVIIVQEYAQRAQRDIVYDLVSKGYTVIIPDCSGIGENYRTEFPSALNTEISAKPATISKSLSHRKRYLSIFIYRDSKKGGYFCHQGIKNKRYRRYRHRRRRGSGHAGGGLRPSLQSACLRKRSGL